MGAFSRKSDIVLPRSPEEGKGWGWEPYESITIKGRATTADLDAVANGEAQGRRTVAMLERFIVKWTLIDENQMPVEVNSESLAALPTEYSMQVVVECGNLLTGNMTEAQQADFLKRATGRTPTS